MFDRFKRAKGPVAAIKDDRPSVPFDKLTPRAFDSATDIFFATDGEQHYLGACMVADPLTGADSATVDKFRAALSMPLPPGSFIQIGMC
jgi:conjugal transfer ATP-binding protein TraC